MKMIKLLKNLNLINKHRKVFLEAPKMIKKKVKLGLDHSSLFRNLVILALQMINQMIMKAKNKQKNKIKLI